VLFTRILSRFRTVQAGFQSNQRGCYCSGEAWKYGGGDQWKRRGDIKTGGQRENRTSKEVYGQEERCFDFKVDLAGLCVPAGIDPLR